MDTQNFYLHFSFFGFYQIYDSLFNSAKLSHLVDWPWSTTCTWCSFLCNLLVNSRASELSSLQNVSMDTVQYLLCIAPAHMSNLVPLLLLLCTDPEKNSWTGGWWSQCTLHPWSELFWWFCCRNPCSCCYMSTRCGKNTKADRGFFSPNQASLTCIYLFWVRPLCPTHLPPPLCSFPFSVLSTT